MTGMGEGTSRIILLPLPYILTLWGVDDLTMGGRAREAGKDRSEHKIDKF